MKIIKNFLIIIPVSLLITSFFTLIKDIVYYEFFGINILKFTTGDEILLSFTNDIIRVIEFTVFTIIFLFIMNNIKLMFKKIFIIQKTWDKFLDDYSSSERKKFFKRKTLILFKSIVFVNVGLLVFFYSILLLYATNLFISIPFLKINLIALIIISILSLFLMYFIRNIAFFKIMFILECLLIAMFLLLLRTTDTFEKVIYEGKNNGVILEFEDYSIKSNNNTIYIGKTNNYIFVYDKDHGESIVYELTKIKSITFPNSKNSDYKKPKK